MIVEVYVPQGIFSEEDREALVSWMTVRPLLSTWSCARREWYRHEATTQVLVREQDAPSSGRAASELRYFVDVWISPGDCDLVEHLIAGITGRITEFEDDPGRDFEPEVMVRVLPLTDVNGDYDVRPYAGPAMAAKCVMEVE